MLKLRTRFSAALVSTFVAVLFAVPVTSAQNSPDVQLSDIKWRPTYSYISGARFNADKSGRLEDDYFGYPLSRPFPYEESKSAPYLQPQAYYLTAKVTNNETKTIRSVAWEITYFEDAAKTRQLGCHTATLMGRVSPGKTKTLRRHLTLGRFTTTPYSTTNLMRVEYTDNTDWVSPALLKIIRGDSQPCGL